MRMICAAVIEAIDEISDSASIRAEVLESGTLHCDTTFLEQFYVGTSNRM